MKLKKFILASVVVIVFLGLGLVAYRLISGRSLGISQIGTRIRAVVGPLLGHNEIVSINNSEFTNIIFIHHSVGNNLIHQGNLREQFQKLGYSFWDQGYMEVGLTRPDGTSVGYSYDIPGDNTDIDGYAAIFQQPVYGLPINTFSALLQHEVIIFKSCFPNSQIDSDAVLETRKQEYLTIRQAIDQQPEHIFFLVTSPPLNPAETDRAAAERARALTNWLISPEYTDGHPNMFVFNYFDLLAENDPAAADANMLKKAFREGTDSHPNETANILIASKLAEFVNTKIGEYRSQIGYTKP